MVIFNSYVSLPPSNMPSFGQTVLVFIWTDQREDRNTDTPQIMWNTIRTWIIPQILTGDPGKNQRPHSVFPSMAYWCVLRREFSGMIHFITSNNPSNPQQPIQQPYVLDAAVSHEPLWTYIWVIWHNISLIWILWPFGDDSPKIKHDFRAWVIPTYKSKLPVRARSPRSDSNCLGHRRCCIGTWKMGNHRDLANNTGNTGEWVMVNNG